MSFSIQLDKDEKGKEVDIKNYRAMIGSLLYLTASRPDIMFSVYLCAYIKQIPKKHTLLPSKGFSVIFKELVTLDFGTRKTRLLI